MKVSGREIKRNKNLIPLVAVLLVSFLLSTAVSLWSMGMMSQDNTREIDTLLAARIYSSIDSSLRESITVARTMSHDRFLIDELLSEDEHEEEEEIGRMQIYLANLKDSLGYDSAFVISEGSRRYYTYEGLLKIVDPSTDPIDIWYALFLEKNKPYDLDVDIDEIGHQDWTVFINARVEDNGRYLGCCGVGVRMTNLQELFREYEREYNVKINLVNRDGLVQVDSDGDNIENVYIDTSILPVIDDGDYVYTSTGIGNFTVTKYIENLDWYLVISSDGASTGMRFLKLIMVNAGLCFLLLVIVLIISRLSVRHVDRLSAATLIDQQTGLFNRRAFEEDRERMSAEDLPERLICLTADINGLKTANDSLGHAAGDELICAAAACLQKCFGEYGAIYRIGGDEFAGFLQMDESELAALQSKFASMTDEYRGGKIGGFAVALGAASRKEYPAANIYELTGISDKHMYEHKTAWYASSGMAQSPR